jgi:hypothetical protein
MRLAPSAQRAKTNGIALDDSTVFSFLHDPIVDYIVADKKIVPSKLMTSAAVAQVCHNNFNDHCFPINKTKIRLVSQICPTIGPNTDQPEPLTHDELGGAPKAALDVAMRLLTAGSRILKHKLAMEAVCMTVQYQMGNGYPLFAV